MNCPKCGWEGEGPHTTASNPSNPLVLCQAVEEPKSEADHV